MHETARLTKLDCLINTNNVNDNYLENTGKYIQVVDVTVVQMSQKEMDATRLFMCVR